MKLRSQLFLLVASAAALFLASVLIYFSLMAPLGAIRSEVVTFQEFSRAASALQIESDLLVVKPFGPQTKAWRAAIDRLHAAQEQLKNVTVLPKTSAEVAKAVEAVQNLGALFEGNLETLEEVLVDIKAAVDEAHLGFEGTDWSQIMRVTSQGELANSGTVIYQLSKMVSELSALNEALTVTRQVVDQKDGEINAAIAALEARGTVVGLLIILVAIGVALFLSLTLARGVSRTVSTIGTTVAKVAQGDLRPRFQSRRKDEFGVLGRDIDALLDALTATFRQIQEVSSENLAVKDQLVRSVSTATASATEIEANSSSILGQLRKADERIQGSEADLNGVVILLEAFHARLGAQAASVAEAGKAVADLAQGVARVSDLSDENRREVEALLLEADRGREVFDHSFAKVAEINESVASIQDLVGSIADIAGQTNILALNAAIEAAHAGEAGRGFAVVADEIGKLASASSASSAQIAATIQEVVEKIREAGATREETLAAFDAIGTQIARVSDRSRGIDEVTDHMNEGTQQIHDVMDSLAAGAQETTQEADRIGSIATKLGDTLGHVGRISHEVVSNVGEIAAGLGEISRTVADIATQSDRLGRVGEDLDRSVNAFQTENAVPTEDEAGVTGPSA